MEEKIGLTVIGVLIAAGLVATILMGLNQQAKADCYKWQDWQKSYQLFKPSSDMVAQCKDLKINLK